jgi:hypothetical protein
MFQDSGSKIQDSKKALNPKLKSLLSFEFLLFTF